MSPHCAPLRWPGEWSEPSALELVKGTPVKCLLVPRGAQLSRLAEAAQRLGIQVIEEGGSPPGVVTIKGQWPGIRMTTRGGGGASAGPTGVPWIDSNGWQVRLAALRNPGKAIWVTADPPKTVIRSASHLIAIADAAASGGDWVVSPDKDNWKSITDALKFFETHRSWLSWSAEAALAVISDFTGPNEFLSTELLNLTARLHQPYRMVEKAKAGDLSGLTAVIYPDAEPPSADLEKRLMRFVESGGLLITRAKAAVKAAGYPPYDIETRGKGRIARGDLQDPFLVAGDAHVLMSHRHDLVRFWNGGSLGSYLTRSPDAKQTLLHVVNYAGRPGVDPVSVRIAGQYASAQISMLEKPDAQPLRRVPLKGAVEMHLPPIAVYAAILLNRSA